MSFRYETATLDGNEHLKSREAEECLGGRPEALTKFFGFANRMMLKQLGAMALGSVNRSHKFTACERNRC